MSIYTGGGDRGKTSLFSGERVSKDHGRIEAYGDVDELNSVLGLLTGAIGPEHPDLILEVQGIQADLFVVGAWLATPEASRAEKLPPLTEDKYKHLEKAIDQMTAWLPPLNGFILPGGHPAAGWSHLARTVCRRTERRVVALINQEEALPPLQNVLVYLNRLSDYLFVLARYCNQITGTKDIEWGRE